jgi:hypothetical protein
MKCMARADDDAEHHRAKGAGNAQLRPEDTRSQHDGQNVDGRSRIEKGRGRAQAGAHAIDTREQGQNGTGADRQNRPGHRSDPIGQHLVGPGAEIFHDRGLADENPYRAGNEKGRHQAQQDMLAGIILQQVEGFPDRILQALTAFEKIHRQVIAGQKYRHHGGQRLPLLGPFHHFVPFW